MFENTYLTASNHRTAARTNYYRIKFIIIISIINPAAQAQVGKTKLFRNCLRNPTSACATDKIKIKLREATNDWQFP